jgi:hypothetical protein
MKLTAIPSAVRMNFEYEAPLMVLVIYRELGRDFNKIMDIGAFIGGLQQQTPQTPRRSGSS